MDVPGYRFNQAPPSSFVVLERVSKLSLPERIVAGRKMFGEEDPRDWKISMAFELSKTSPVRENNTSIRRF